MAKQILLKHGNVGEVAKVLNCTYPTIRSALQYKTDTKKAKKIRHVAIKHYGGIEVEY